MADRRLSARNSGGAGRWLAARALISPLWRVAVAVAIMLDALGSPPKGRDPSPQTRDCSIIDKRTGVLRLTETPQTE
jgi:hypothetical protein